jgi:hypothetical protein
MASSSKVGFPENDPAQRDRNGQVSENAVFRSSPLGAYLGAVLFNVIRRSTRWFLLVH